MLDSLRIAPPPRNPRPITVSVVVLVATLILAPSFAQDWVHNSFSETLFNCELVELVAAIAGGHDYAKVGNETLSFSEYHTDCEDTSESQSRAEEAQFKVTVSSQVNLRDCGSTSCAKVGSVSAGDILEVLDEEDSWYRVRLSSGETAYIAGWLTRRLPDHTIETGEPYFFNDRSCLILADSSRSSDMDISFVLSGESLGGLVADLYLPNQSQALQVNQQYDKTFIDTGDLYILQTYRWNQWFPEGMYTIEVEVGDEAFAFAWDMSGRAEYLLRVNCD
ncbi:MAG: SH3 domain-containing protein [Chloroflexi bacterium]|nr:SH3 domain-containing protein [Chloroflexota bacterium]